MAIETTGESTFGDPPSIGPRATLDAVAAGLRALRDEAGSPSYTEIARRIGTLRTDRGDQPYLRQPGRVTVYECFRSNRRRMDVALVMDIVRVLGSNEAQATGWRRACQAAQQRSAAADIVSVRDTLPAVVEPFVGRQDVIDTVAAAFDAERTTVVVLTGMPGVGKTQAAVRAATLLHERGVVDTTVMADLRGHHADMPPADPEAVVDATVNLLGSGAAGPRAVPARKPTGRASAADRLRAYTDAVRDRRILLLLDDAASADQVAATVPRARGALVLVTSRRNLEIPAATTVTLRGLDEDDAVALMERIIGGRAADRATTAAVADAVGNLPLALGLTAARIVNRPDWSMADHLHALHARQDHLRLDAPVEATLDLSYRVLTPDAARTLRLIAAQPAPDLGLSTIAALADHDEDTAGTLAAELAQASLVISPSPDRYSLHDLVKVYAAARSVEEDPPGARDAALDRVLDHYLTAAGDRVSGNGNGSVEAWLGAEYEAVLTLVTHPFARRRSADVVSLANDLSKLMHHLQVPRRGVVLNEHALARARHLGDEYVLARAHGNLGQSLLDALDVDAATSHLEIARSMLQRLGCSSGESAAVNSLGLIAGIHGRHDEALRRFRAVLGLQQEVGSPLGRLSAHGNIADTLRLLGRPGETIGHYDAMLIEATDIGHPLIRSQVLAGRCHAQVSAGAVDDAVDSGQEALQLARTAGSLIHEAYGATATGTALSARGDHEPALALQRHALTLSRTIPDERIEATVLNDLGAALHAAGDADATVTYRAALTVASQLGDQWEQARAHRGLAALATSIEEARIHARWAAGHYAARGLPEADVVRAEFGLVDAGDDAA